MLKSPIVPIEEQFGVRRVGTVADVMRAADAAIAHIPSAADWRVAPEAHAATLPPEAGALARVLERADLKGIIARFNVADEAAGAAQRRYKRIGRAGLYAATTATAIGTLFLLPIEGWLAGPLGMIASSMQVAALMMAILASRLLSYLKPFGTWMRQRAVAEIARIELFDTVTREREPAQSGEHPFLALMLVYYTRFQLDVQRRYYRERGNQHAAAVWRNNRWLNASLLITVVSGILAVLAGLHIAARIGLPVPGGLAAWSAEISHGGVHRITLALGVLASAFYGLGAAHSLMDLDERNASRYLTNAENLDFLADHELAAAREAAAAGHTEPVLEFIARVQDLVSSEHREWLLLRERPPLLRRPV